MKARKSNKAQDYATASARIRENQRRSRTRRKEYIQQLEQRLSAFEKLGVEATQEVQKAGRKVATENDLLRSLLMLHGITKSQIEEYLESRRRPTNPPPSQCLSAGSLALPKIRQPTAPSQPPEHDHSSMANLSHWDSNNPPQELQPIRAIYSSPKPDAKTDREILNIQESRADRADAPGSVAAEPVWESQQDATAHDTGQFTSEMPEASA
ncbi:hypothetical protein N7486_009495 [Penicillium sp. IBT 16267x]|nr:hypothetical protein N7486_009495 [Penicillium sp. IBT 16267x]